MFRIQVETAPPIRILELQWRDLVDGHESEAVIELTRPDGTKTVVREFWRHSEEGDRYVTVRHTSRNGAPAQTFLVFGRKGEVEGEFRSDRAEMLVFESDGTVRRTEQSVKTWLPGDLIRQQAAGWYRDGTQAGMTPDQIWHLIWSLESPRDAV